MALRLKIENYKILPDVARASTKQLPFAHMEPNGEGAIKCVGMVNPKISRNNFFDNTFAVQSFSSIYVDARKNWWGNNPPDPKMILGENINIKPWLDKEEPKAFREKQ